MYALIADGILILHFGVIAFILAEQACIAIGFFRNWRWVRNLRFRVCHLLAIGVVAAQAWLGRLCPLTIWENALREAAGESPYPGTFIAHWFGALVYHDAPPWAFAAAYTLFGAVALCSWILVRPQKGTVQAGRQD